MSDQNETWPEKLHLSDMHASEIVNWMQDFDAPEAGYADSRGHYTRDDLYAAVVAERDALRAEVKRLREALKPFADALSRYSRNSHELIALVDDFTGERLNVLHRDCWNRAAALGEGKP